MRNLIKIFSLLLLIAIFCFFKITPCYSLEQTFKVGVISPTSGPMAEYGLALTNGINLAIEDLNISPQVIKFIFEDASYDAKQAVAAYRKLKNINKVDLIYVWGVSFCKAIAPLAEQDKQFIVTQCVDYKSALNKKYVLRFMNPSDQYAEKMLEYLAKIGKKNISLIVSENAYLEELASSYLKAASKLNIKINLERVSVSENYFISHILKSKQKNPDAIGLLLLSGAISKFSQELKTIKWQPLLFSSNVAESSAEIKAANGSLNGTLIPSHKISNEFIEKYLLRFNHDGQINWAALSFDFVHVLHKALLDKTQTNLFRKIELQLPEINNASGSFKFIESSAYGKFFEFPLVIKKILPSNFIYAE